MACEQAVDWSNPTARLKALEDAYHELITGQREIRVRFKNGDHEQEVQFQPAKLEELKAAIAETRAQITGTPRRSAIRAGALGSW